MAGKNRVDVMHAKLVRELTTAYEAARDRADQAEAENDRLIDKALSLTTYLNEIETRVTELEAEKRALAASWTEAWAR
jgi:phage shock protein A